jgi:hypothetical protein
MASQGDSVLLSGDSRTPNGKLKEPPSVEVTEPDNHKSASGEDQDDKPKKQSRALSFARRAKRKAKEVFTSGSREDEDPGSTPGKEVVDEVSSDPAFNPSLILNESPPKLSKGEHSTIKSDLKLAANSIAHPRRTIQEKATRSAAAKISKAQRPFLSAEQDRNLLSAHDQLDKLTSSRSSVNAHTPVESGAEMSGEEEAARQKVEDLEEQRSGLLVAWTLGKHVDRVRIVQAKLPEPRSREDFIERAQSGEPGRFQWERWLGYQALYYTRGFTARYIDDFKAPPFDIEDLARIVERLVIVSAPWQAWLVSIRQVYTWENPKRTGKWFALFWFLWYTEHIMGFAYAYIIYTVTRNKYHPSSIESVRHSMKRGVDREANAQAWGEVVEKHGRKEWVEPLLDQVGPHLQLQLGDLADLLEVLANFYRWKSPWKTAASLFFFGCCLLITLLTSMAFCMKIVWFVAGGWFFFCFPIASQYPEYRYLVDPLKWIFWDIPTNAEWSIGFLQRKASKQQEEIDQRERMNDLVASTDDEISGSDYETPRPSPQLDTTDAEGDQIDTGIFKFRAFQSTSRGHFHIGRDGVGFSSRTQSWAIPYGRLIEMCKVKPDPAIKTVTFGFASSRLRFVGKDAEGENIDETIAVNRDKRDEIFNLVLGWSGLRWRALCMERHKSKNAEGKKKQSWCSGTMSGQ